jgi:hypothetical protein
LAITNLVTAIGLQAQGLWANRVKRLHQYFTDEYQWERDTGDPLGPILFCLSQNPGLILGG